MATDNFEVNLPIDTTITMIDKGIVEGSFTGEKIDHYPILIDGEVKIIVLVYEKHFYRAGNRLTLTVTVSNLGGFTKVHSVGGGGGEGFLRFDWGAGKKFSNAPREILKGNIL